MNAVMFWFWKPIGEALGALVLAVVVGLLYVGFLIGYAKWSDFKARRKTNVKQPNK